MIVYLSHDCFIFRNEIAMMMVYKLPVKFGTSSDLCRVRAAQLEILLQAQASMTDVQQLVQLILKGLSLQTLLFVHVS